MGKRQRHRNLLLDFLAYAVGRMLGALVHACSWEARYAGARFIADLLFRFDRRHRRRALEHVRKSFPQWDDPRCHRVAKESFRSMAYMAVEALMTPRVLRPDTWRRHVTLQKMPDLVRLLTTMPDGIIFLTGHFGNWEVGGHILAALGFPTVSIARRDRNVFNERFITRQRQRAGQRIIDKDGATEEAPRVLAAHGALGIIADQDAGRKGMFVDFFGRKASTYKSVGLLAMEFRVPVLVMVCRRKPGFFQFEVRVQRVIQPAEWDAQADPLRWITQEYTTAIEAAARACPEQYFWVHRRWKHRPRGEPEAADGIA